VQLGYLTNILRLDERVYGLSILLFFIATLAIYFMARFSPMRSAAYRDRRFIIFLLTVSLLVGITQIVVSTQLIVLPGEWGSLFIMITSFIVGALCCLSILSSYELLSGLSGEKPLSILLPSLLGGILLFLIAYWLESVARIVLYDLLCAFGCAALFVARRLSKGVAFEASSTRQHLSQEASSTHQHLSQEASLLEKPQINLNRFTHFTLFAIQLALGYTLGITMSQWTSFTVTVAVILTGFASVFYRQISRYIPLALGELGKIALPVCIALLFSVILDIDLVNHAALVVTLVFFMSFEMLNVLWLIRTATAFNLDSARHIATGRFPLILGTLCGVALGVFIRQAPILQVFGEGDMTRVVASGVVSIVVVVTYAMLPFNQGTPVREGIIPGDFSNVDTGSVPSLPKQKGRPFKESCAEFGKQYGLTPRESDVLFLLACGYNAENIAQILFISSSTARTHTHRIYNKTGIHSQQMLIKTLDLESNKKRP
jgi:DNA-binding CsgD family transcriptional regulator